LLSGVAGALGLSALAMAMVGLSGVLSMRLADRRRELGVHTALGATRRALIRLVLADGLRPVAEGLVIGAGLGSVARLAMQPVFRTPVDATHWPVLGLIVPLLLLAAGLACFGPARRAATADPAELLRGQ
jgi:ABC-type lipoprotein release transport system permease subunit